MSNLDDSARHGLELGQLDTCVLSDALDKLGIRGVAFGLRQLAARKRIAGRVITVTLGLAEGTIAARHLCAEAVDDGGSGDVIVVEHHAHPQAAGWGGILSFAAKARGIEGVIVDGMCRDLDEANDLDFPVYGAGAVPSTARGRVMEVAYQEPIMVSGVEVRPGDWVLADRSGVVFIPAGRIKDVIGTARDLAEREQKLVSRIRAGEAVSSVMGHQYESMIKDRDDE